MSDELLKLLAGTGVGGILAVLVWLELRAFRREHRADMAELRDASANVPDWLQAIHSRLGNLGADSVPPPIAEPPRRRKQRPERLERLRTAPTGVPINRAVPDPVDE